MEDDTASTRTGVTRKSAQTKPMALENVTPATRLLEKRRQMFEVQEALEHQKAEFERKEELFRRREEGLKKKDLDLQENLIKFSKFLQDNDSKRARADKKAAEEVRGRLAREREIEQLTDALEQLREEKEHIHEVLGGYMRYQSYLESVLEVADEYQEIQDLLTRHATLSATSTDLQQHQARCDTASEATHAELAVCVKWASDALLSLNNQVAQLKKQLEAQQAAAAVHEAQKDYALGVASKATLECGQVVTAIDNIFNRCLQHTHVAHHSETHPLKQLEVVANFVADLDSLLKQQQQQHRRSMNSG